MFDTTKSTKQPVMLLCAYHEELLCFWFVTISTSPNPFINKRMVSNSLALFGVPLRCRNETRVLYLKNFKTVEPYGGIP